jgi:hypothetical protein
MAILFPQISRIYRNAPGMRPLDFARNGIGPPGSWTREYAGEYLNQLAAGRLKVPFQKHIPHGRHANASDSPADTWRFAFHSSPLATELTIRMVLAPTTVATAAASATWTSETGLTGSGTTAVHPAVQSRAAEASKDPPSNWYEATARCPISSDTDYRFTLAVDDGAFVISATAYETPRTSLDTATDTLSVDPRPFVDGQPIYDAQAVDFLAALDKQWKRGRAHLGSWCVDAVTAETRTSATYANLWNQSVTAYRAYDAAPSSPGWIVTPAYRDSLDSTNVACVGYCYASQAAATGNVRFVGASGTLATIAITGAATWYSTTFNLSGATATDKIEVMIAGSGAAAVSLYAAGAFIYE